MTLRDFAGWPSGPLHVAIGVFDGVHRGHQALIAETARRARAAGGTAVAVTFDPLPVEVFAPGAPPSRLSDVDERAALMRASGAQDVAVLHFTREMASWPPRLFAERVAGAGTVREIVVGDDFRFGHDRAGDVAMLASFGGELGFRVFVMPPVLHEGRAVSSTRVRNALLAGDVAEAAVLLGRRYAVAGAIEHGDPHGRELGFPTVRAALPPRRLLPRDGIYAVWATLGGARRGAAASLGVRSGERRLEAFLLDAEGTAMGETLGAEFVAWLRDELRFAGARELAEQITEDVARTRDALA